MIRNTSLVSGLLGQTLDGSGIGIAIIDSGMDVSHKAFGAKLDLSGSRVKFKKDFTVEGKADKDFYGHGTHVAASAAGMSTVAGALMRASQGAPTSSTCACSTRRDAAASQTC